MTPVESFHFSATVFTGSPAVPITNSFAGSVSKCIGLEPSAIMSEFADGFATPVPPFVGNRTDAPTAFELARLSDWNSGSAEPPFATSGAPDAELGPTPTMFEAPSPISTECAAGPLST
jgi:hypothetical protein